MAEISHVLEMSLSRYKAAVKQAKDANYNLIMLLHCVYVLEAGGLHLKPLCILALLHVV